MARTVITIDGDTRLDADLERWEHPNNPADLMNLLKPTGHPPKPWMIATMIALTHAITGHQPTHIDVRTQPMGWTLHVRETL
jgi:hypothetical protein